MQDFRTEVCEFGSFFEVEFFDRGCVFDESWVVVVHTVDVGPNLDFFGGNSGTDKRGGVVAAAALEVVDFAVSVTADVTLSDVKVGFGVLVEQVVKSLTDVVVVGLAVFVGFHIFESRDQFRLDAFFVEV